MNALIAAWAPVFAVGFAVQQFLEILCSFFDAFAKFKKHKKLTLGIVSLVLGFSVAFEVDGLRVLRPLFAGLPPAEMPNIPEWLDKIVTGLVISAGTEGLNSILKFLKYSKEDKKMEAAKKIDPAAASVGTVTIVPTSEALAAMDRK